jgi:hypothetical protein
VRDKGVPLVEDDVVDLLAFVRLAGGDRGDSKVDPVHALGAAEGPEQALHGHAMERLACLEDRME